VEARRVLQREFSEEIESQLEVLVNSANRRSINEVQMRQSEERGSLKKMFGLCKKSGTGDVLPRKCDHDSDVPLYAKFMDSCSPLLRRHDLSIQAIMNSLWVKMRHLLWKLDCAAGLKCDMEGSMRFALKGCEQSIEDLDDLSLDAILNDNKS
jgi:hypothetical protein